MVDGIRKCFNQRISIPGMASVFFLIDRKLQVMYKFIDTATMTSPLFISHEQIYVTYFPKTKLI